MLILFVCLIIFACHLAAWNIGWRLHADARVWISGCSLLLVLLVVLLLDSGGASTIGQVIVHYLSPFSLVLNGSGAWPDNIVLTIFLFLEADIL
jgi:hypothetical protein